MQHERPKIDRWNSKLLDVHKWSEHPEIKALAERLYFEADVHLLDKLGNRKAKREAKDMLRVLLLDLYVCWLHDPTRAIGFSKNKNSYKVHSRYNPVYISDQIIKVEAALHGAGWLDELPSYHDKTGQSESHTTRIRASHKLGLEFEKMLVDLYDIDFDVVREVIILREKFEDEEGNSSWVNLDYQDTDCTNAFVKSFWTTTNCFGKPLSTSQLCQNHLS